MNNLQWRSEAGRDEELTAWEVCRKVPSPPVAKQALVRDYAERWGLTVLVESGTYLGEMVRATGDLFDSVYTIELGELLYEQAVRTFAEHPHVHCLHGDSAQVLPDVLSSLDHAAVLWLDGHWSEGNTALGDRETPIVAELGDALSRPERHVILIDDARCFADGAEPHPDYPTIAWVERMAGAHRYSFSLADDVMRLEPIIPVPSFSVLMPTRDRQAFIGAAVESVLSQDTRLDFQLIVKNGGDSITNLLPRDPRLLLIDEPDSGIPDAMNQAMARAEGDVLHWANDDDLMEPDALIFVSTWLHDAEWGFGRIRMVDQHGDVISIAGGGAWDADLNLQANGVPQPATYWRRRMDVAPFDIEVGPSCDFDYWTRLGRVAEPKVTERILASYTCHPQSLSVARPDLLAASADAVRAKHGGHRP